VQFKLLHGISNTFVFGSTLENLVLRIIYVFSKPKLYASKVLIRHFETLASSSIVDRIDSRCCLWNSLNKPMVNKELLTSLKHLKFNQKISSLF